MINQAMFHNKGVLNEFTSLIKEQYELTKKPILVETRNNTYFKVIYQQDLGNDTEPLFRTEDWSLVWYLDGSSCKNNDLDLCYLG